MRIECVNGFYRFYPRSSLELAKFEVKVGIKLKKKSDFFTFAALAALPSFALKGQLYGNLIAIKNYEGEVEEVMKENSMTYNLSLELLVPTASIVTPARIVENSSERVSTNLIQAYSFYNGRRIVSYSCDLQVDMLKFNYWGFVLK